MDKEVFTYKTKVLIPAQEVFDWFKRPNALIRLIPPWENVKVISKKGSIQNGEVEFLIRIGFLKKRWISKYTDYVEGEQFKDIQVKGPFTFWEHTYSVKSEVENTCYLEDRIEYTLPFGYLGKFIISKHIKNKLSRIMAYRHRTLSNDLEVHRKYADNGKLKILVTGSTGFIGSNLVSFLTTGGHEVIRLARTQINADEKTIYWDTHKGIVDKSYLEGLDAIIHLSGSSIATRWTPDKKAEIRDSRILGTRLLCEVLSELSNPPKVFISASAIGFYGSRGNEILTEESPAGTGFLAQICNEWEQVTKVAKDKGIRVVNLRIGMVLSAAGGALAKMLTPFKLGFGGKLGSGSQFISWICLDDLLYIILACIMEKNLSGPVNAVSPNPVTNKEFTEILGKILKRPTIFSMPAFAVKLIFGEIAKEVMLASTKVLPKKIQDTGYKFYFPDLESALRHVLGRLQLIS